MRIAYISYEYPPDIYAGGIATYIYEAARMMQQAGWETEVFTGSFTRNEQTIEDGIKVHRILISDVEDYKKKVAEVFAVAYTENPFDLYETPEINSNALLIAARFPRVPFTTRLHTPLALQTGLMNYYRPFSGKLRFFLGALRRGKWDAGYWRPPGARKEADLDYQMTIAATAVSSPSKAMKDWAVKHWNIPAQKISVIPNLFSPSPELLSQAYKAERPFLTFIGKINIQKGMFMLMRAIPKILAACPHITVCLVGGDWQGPGGEPSMMAVMKKYWGGETERIKFTGSISREELYTYLNQSAACIFPSIWEAFGYVALEAMSAGVPVLTGKGSGFSEIIDSGKYGVEFNPQDHNDIANKTIGLLKDKNKMTVLSEAGRTRVTKHYTAGALVKKYEDFYSGVTGRGL